MGWYIEGWIVSGREVGVNFGGGGGAVGVAAAGDEVGLWGLGGGRREGPDDGF